MDLVSTTKMGQGLRPRTWRKLRRGMASGSSSGIPSNRLTFSSALPSVLELPADLEVHPGYEPNINDPPRSFILARTKLGYKISCSSFVNLIEDDECCSNPSCSNPSCLAPCLPTGHLFEAPGCDFQTVTQTVQPFQNSSFDLDTSAQLPFGAFSAEHVHGSWDMLSKRNILSPNGTEAGSADNNLLNCMEIDSGNRMVMVADTASPPSFSDSLNEFVTRTLLPRV
ncbi:hypothetical protein BU16DRAFT_358472 [Lophium mytilinum]|uniref:Uncharacterized protein n=1 Tax=Lophium mytilinum TaxID=390894 RepID=A0A6A6QXQ9_9PEZI|nr:hypothetical protein BU16DRAFT_358472 [Lophium mytilinum]